MRTEFIQIALRPASAPTSTIYERRGRRRSRRRCDLPARRPRSPNVETTLLKLTSQSIPTCPQFTINPSAGEVTRTPEAAQLSCLIHSPFLSPDGAASEKRVIVFKRFTTTLEAGSPSVIKQEASSSVLPADVDASKKL
ncbi:hypothetical protein EVAR_76620_1 [Eumeta japonica]|uniref:Uncharacterized protein n=1 Tax=Eumeta variegata TaxID=151549 RepID=A0A4C1T627_EUMVA|nr:hypothetical protein EVAR_76620_1 [Eumeta japonica]